MDDAEKGDVIELDFVSDRVDVKVRVSLVHRFAWLPSLLFGLVQKAHIPVIVIGRFDRLRGVRPSFRG